MHAEMQRTGLLPVHVMQPLPTAWRVFREGFCHCFFRILSRENLYTCVPVRHISFGARFAK